MLYLPIQFSLAGAYAQAALDKSPSEDEKEQAIEDNGRTIRPMRSPKGLPLPLPRPVSNPLPAMDPIVEDYSDLAMDEDDSILQDKVAEFRVRLYKLLSTRSQYLCRCGPLCAEVSFIPTTSKLSGWGMCPLHLLLRLCPRCPISIRQHHRLARYMWYVTGPRGPNSQLSLPQRHL